MNSHYRALRSFAAKNWTNQKNVIKEIDPPGNGKYFSHPVEVSASVCKGEKSEGVPVRLMWSGGLVD